MDSALDGAADVIGRAGISLHGPAFLRGAGGRHGYPEKAIEERTGQAPDTMLRPGEKDHRGHHGKQNPYPGNLYVKIIGKSAAHAAEPFVGQVPEQFFPGLFRTGFGSGIIGLDGFRTADDINHPLDSGKGDDSAFGGVFLQEFGHPLLDAFHDFFPAFLFEVVGFQGLQIAGQRFGRILFQIEGITAYAELNGFFHDGLLF